jgi:hypothetical protein
MLNSEEEAALRESLRFREEDRWLHLLYRCASSSSAHRIARVHLLIGAPEFHSAHTEASPGAQSLGDRHGPMDVCACRAKSKKHDQAHTMDATLAALEAPAPAHSMPSAPVARQGTPPARVEPLQPSTSARVNSHTESGSRGVRTRARAQREASPNGQDTVRRMVAEKWFTQHMMCALCPTAPLSHTAGPSTPCQRKYCPGKERQTQPSVCTTSSQGRCLHRHEAGAVPFNIISKEALRLREACALSYEACCAPR